MARTHRAPRRAQIFRGNASRAGNPIWNGRIESGRNGRSSLSLLVAASGCDGRLRLEARRHNGACLAASLNISLGGQQRIGRFDRASCQTQFLGQRTCRGYPVTRFQHAAGNGAAKPIVDLPIKRYGRVGVQWRNISGFVAVMDYSAFLIN